jgi:hypothetical protein
VGDVTLATLDLSQADHDAYYLGYANSVLWPVFHNRLDLAALERGDLDGYRRVNRLFAQRLAALLRPDDVVWVHDYHLIPLAAELRALGCTQRIGFFLHIPLPPPLLMAAIPQHEWLMRSLFAYDLIGFQSETDVAHFSRYVRQEGQAAQRDDDHFEAFGRSVRARAIPIGIDVDEFQALGRGREAREMAATLRAQHGSRSLLVGVDRLDYSKGLPQRCAPSAGCCRTTPRTAARPCWCRWPRPRARLWHAYAELRTELETLSGQINGEHGEIDWMPVRYLHRTVSRRRLPGCTPRPRGAGHAAARRHEPGGQGVRGGAGPGRPGRAGAVALCRRGRADGRRAAGQSLRHRRRRPGHATRAAHAAGRAAHPPRTPAGRPAHARRALVAARLPSTPHRGPLAMNPENYSDNLLWLWQGMGGATTPALRITVIIVAAWVLIGVLQRAIRGFRLRLAERMDDPEAKKRAETLGRVFRYLVAVVVSLVAGMLVLGEIGISVAPILGAAGVVGLAVGFGAQSLVKDYFTGLFLLLEDQVRTGDIVRLSPDHAGVVEEVTLRYVRLRDYDGNVHFVPAGQITSVINLTRGYSQAVMDIGVAYREDVDEVMAVMRDGGAGCAPTPSSPAASSTTSRWPAWTSGPTRRWSSSAGSRSSPSSSGRSSASTCGG